MKCVVTGAFFNFRKMVSVSDGVALMSILGRAQEVKHEYNKEKNVYEYILQPAREEMTFTLVSDASVKLPEDLKTMVQVKREMMSERGNELPESYVIPDEGVNVE